MPPAILAGCDDALVAGAPDLRGLWQVVEVIPDGDIAATSHPAIGSTQRIEQAGNRLVVTAGGIIHDMRCDGTVENGVNDVAEFDKSTAITVVATYEGDVHVLRPVGLPIEVRRWRDGDHMMWKYLKFTARLKRIGYPSA